MGLRFESAIVYAGLMAAAMLSCDDGVSACGGCPGGGVALEFVGELPDSFTVTATGEWPGRAAVNQSLVRQCVRALSCEWLTPEDPRQVNVFVDIPTPVLIVHVEWNDSDTMFVLHPSFEDIQTDGSGCSPCWVAFESVRLQ